MIKFNNEFLQRLKDTLYITDVIQSYGVDIKKKGSKYWACCPFHNERTPSFSISLEEGFYYCFGCHVSGDMITFVEKMESMSFTDAVEKLANMAHMEIPEESYSEEEKKEAAFKEQLYKVAQLAGEYFHNCLLKTQMGKAGLAYFTKRHLSRETIEKFKLGFAPPEWDRLYRDFIERKHVRSDVLIQSGLVGVKNNRHYDVFRNRCMFPIMDLRGKVVAFGGRVLNSQDSLAKYLNSPETPIFNKRRLLFPIYQALPEIRKKRQAIMVEGYMDAISLHTHGIQNAVASLGTAFTIEQARLLKRYADEVVFSYDMDSAGQNATKRALEIAGSVGLKLRVALIGEGKDPDEFVNLHGGEAFLEVVKQAEPALDYLFHSLCKQYDGTTLDGQQHILTEMFSSLAAQENTYVFNAFIRKMSKKLHMDEGLIRSEAIRYTKENHSKVYISPRTNSDEIGALSKDVSQKQCKMECEILRYCLIHRMFPEELALLDNYQFTLPFYDRLYKILKSMKGQEISVEKVEMQLGRDETQELAKLMLQENNREIILKEYIRLLRKIYLQNEYKYHTKRASELMITNPEEAKKEQMICIELSNEIRLL